MAHSAPHQHVVPPWRYSLPIADRPVQGFPSSSETCEHQDGRCYRPDNENMFVEGMRSVLRGVKRMKKETKDFCGLFGHLHYSEPDDWRHILAPRDKLMDFKMLNALLNAPPKAPCYCSCFCPSSMNTTK